LSFVFSLGQDIVRQNRPANVASTACARKEALSQQRKRSKGVGGKSGDDSAARGTWTALGNDQKKHIVGLRKGPAIREVQPKPKKRKGTARKKRLLEIRAVAKEVDRSRNCRVQRGKRRPCLQPLGRGQISKRAGAQAITEKRLIQPLTGKTIADCDALIQN